MSKQEKPVSDLQVSSVLEARIHRLRFMGVEDAYIRILIDPKKKRDADSVVQCLEWMIDAGRLSTLRHVPTSGPKRLRDATAMKALAEEWWAWYTETGANAKAILEQEDPDPTKAPDSSRLPWMA